MTLKINRAPLLCCFKLCPPFHSHQWIQTRVIVRKPPIWVKINDFFVLCDLEIWWMTLKNNRTPLLFYVKLSASFQSHQWIQTWVTILKHSIQIKISNFFVPCDLEFDLEKQYANSSFVHHFVAIGEFKLESQSGKVQFGSKSTSFFLLCDLEISQMTLKNDRAPLLSKIKHHFIIICEFNLESWSGNG